MSQTSTSKTITILRYIFSIFGLPQQLVTDNGLQFIAEEFRQFCRENGVKHIRSVPYHPSTKEVIERFVQTFKKSLKSGRKEGKPLQCVV